MPSLISDQLKSFLVVAPSNRLSARGPQRKMQTMAAAAVGAAAAEGGQREGNRSRSPRWLLKVAAVLFVALAAVVVAIVVSGRGGGGGERAAEGGGDTVGGRAACALGSVGGRKHVRPRIARSQYRTSYHSLCRPWWGQSRPRCPTVTRSSNWGRRGQRKRWRAAAAHLRR